MTRALRLSIFSLVPFLIILFSLSVFSCNASAKELITTESILLTRNDGLQEEWRVDPRIAHEDVYYGFYYSSGSSDYMTLFFFSESSFNIQGRNGAPISVNSNWSSVQAQYSNRYGIYHYTINMKSYALGSSNLQYDPSRFVEMFGNNIYETVYELVESEVFVPEAFANFGLKDFKYITYSYNSIFIVNDIYELSYYLTWSGSDNSDYPLTSVRYELYGFSSVNMSNYDKSNGVLVEDGVCSSPFDYDVYSKVKNFSGQSNYEKFIIYLIPYSGLTEGNTSFVVCDTFTCQLSIDFGAIEIPVGGLTGLEATFGDGVIPVTPTAVINNTGVNYIDDVPVMGITQTVSGTFNNNYNTYNHNINYNPIVYDTTNNISNYYDNSTNITNNDNSTTIINNFNGNYNFDSDDSINGLIDFIKAILLFFTTCWNLFSVNLAFIPAWAISIVTALISVTSSILIGIVIFRLVRG